MCDLGWKLRPSFPLGPCSASPLPAGSQEDGGKGWISGREGRLQCSAPSSAGTGEAFFTETASTPHPLCARKGRWSYLSRCGFLQVEHGFSQFALRNLLLL